MTQKIKILDPSEAIKIAAGEVIERPAHIIKELLENSIDAGAKNISLHLQRAGKDLIKITDDGCGMSPQDAELCFAHHATSKIQTVHDLSSITTYGFRGEALSSIASVSHVELITKTEDDTLATKIVIDHGNKIETSNINHQPGTTLVISELFKNIPARKKFLKTDETEWNLIVTIFQAFALRFPQIFFKVFHNDNLAYNCPATPNLKTRCSQLWNSSIHEHLLELSLKNHENIKVSGAISSMHYSRFNRGQIFTFVNNRWVKNSEISKGILKGYEGVLPFQKFPAAFIFIDINPQEIDVNIHPKKEEVKFLNPTTIQRVVQNCIKNQLETVVTKTLEKPTIEKSINPIQNSFNFTNLAFNKKNDLTNYNEALPNAEFKTPPAKSKLNHQDIFQTFDLTKNEKVSKVESDTNITIDDQESFNIIGQFKKTYLLVEKNSDLILIDQHAAHERILYERFKSTTQKQEHVALIFPHIVKLSLEQVQLIENYQKAFQDHAILLERFSDCEIIIQATPVQMTGPSAAEIIKTVLEWMQTHHDLEVDTILQKLHEKILIEKACKTAFKAGDLLSIEQMQSLLAQLQKTEQNFCCPHGRPTMWTTKLKDIEKHFKRDYVGSKSLF